MDPLVSLQTMRDGARSYTTRIAAGQALLAWLRNGGFVPQGTFPEGVSWGGHQARAWSLPAALRFIGDELDHLIDERDEFEAGLDRMEELRQGNLYGRNVL